MGAKHLIRDRIQNTGDSNQNKGFFLTLDITFAFVRHMIDHPELMETIPNGAERKPVQDCRYRRAVMMSAVLPQPWMSY